MDLNGGARHHIPAKRTSHISSMTVFDDHLFWSDWNLREVIRADKWTGMNETILKTTTQLPSDIRVTFIVKHALPQLRTVSTTSCVTF